MVLTYRIGNPLREVYPDTRTNSNIWFKNVSELRLEQLYPSTTYFRPLPNFDLLILCFKNLNSLNFAAVMVSLFTGGIIKLGTGLLSALVVECEPWINIVLEDPFFFSLFLLPNYLLVFIATVSKCLIHISYFIHLHAEFLSAVTVVQCLLRGVVGSFLYICMMNCVACDYRCQLVLKSLQNKFILR